MDMRRKKMFEKEIAKLEAMQLTLEQQCFTIEAAKANMDVVSAITEGANQMKKGGWRRRGRRCAHIALGVFLGFRIAHGVGFCVPEMS